MATPPSITCGYSSVGAAATVQEKMLYLTGLANEVLNAAIVQAEQIGNVAISAPSISVTMDNPEMMQPVAPPGAPTLAEIEFGSFTPPVMATLNFPDEIDLSVAPTAPANPPLPNTVPQPTPFSPTTLNAPAVESAGDAPEYVAVENPVDLPALFALSLPAVPPLETLLFSTTRPTTIPSLPDATFSFVEDAYSSTLLDALRAKFLEILDGGTGLPAAAVEAMRSRLYSEAEIVAQKATDEVLSTWAGRNFYAPPGTLNAALLRIQRENSTQRGAAMRDVYLKEVDTQIDMLKTALAQGNALEEVLIRLHISVQDRKLQAARALVDVAIALFNVQVERLNAEIALYNADVAVFRARIEAQLAQVQVYAEQIRAQGIVGELNRTLVQMYSEGFRAVEANASAYRAEVDGYRARIEATGQVVDIFRSQVEAERTRVETHALQIQAYAESIRAEGLTQENYKIRAETYAARINGWNTENQARIEAYKAELMQVEALIRKYEALVRGYQAELDTERTRIEAIGRNNELQLQTHGITTQAVIAQNEAALRKGLANLEEVKARAQLGLQEGSINSENALNAANLMLRGNETAAQVYSNLASAIVSGINVSAGISDTASTSQGCDQSVNYSSTF